MVPGPSDIARFDALSPDAELDSASSSVLLGLTLESGYSGTLALHQDLSVRGDLVVRGGVLEQGRHRLSAFRLTQSGGTLVGGAAPLVVTGAARVLGGLLETPRDVMIVATLDIRAPGVARVGANGRLEVSGDGTPLTGDGLLDVTTNRPTSVEYTGRATSDLTAAGPAAAYLGLGVGHERDRDLRPLAAGQENRSGGPAGLGFGDPATALTLQRGEWWLASAVIDTVAGFAYFGTGTSPSRVVKVRLSDFTRAGAVTLGTGDGPLLCAVIDPAQGFAYFGTYTVPGKVVKIRLSDLTRVAALGTGVDHLVSAVIDPAAGFAYSGSEATPQGSIVKVRLSDFTRAGALSMATESLFRSAVVDPAAGFAYFAGRTGTITKVRLSDCTRAGALRLTSADEQSLFTAVIDPAAGFAYFGSGTDLSGGLVVKVRLSDFTRVGALTLDSTGGPRSAAIDPAAGFAYFGTDTSPGLLVKVRLSDCARIATLTFDAGDTPVRSAVIDPAAGVATFGTNTGPGIVVRIRLSDFTRAGSLTLDTAEADIGYLTSAVIDPTTSFAYFGTTTSPLGTSPVGTIFRVDVSAPAPPCTGFTLTPDAAYPDDRGGSTAVAVTGIPAGCRGGSWTASGNGSWLTVAPAGGSGPGTVTVSFAQNTSAFPRTANATIAGQPFAVTQAAAPPALGIDDVPGDGRFRAQVRWSTTQGGSDGRPHAGQPLSTAGLGVARGGLFWFFQADNPEMLVKVLNGCSVNGKYWVFASAGTNVGTTTRVTDTVTGAVATYVNPDLTAAQPVQDTVAFACD